MWMHNMNTEQFFLFFLYDKINIYVMNSIYYKTRSKYILFK